jgi:hypothetical protein
MFRTRITTIAALAICALLPLRAEDHSDDHGSLAAGSIAYQYVGRVNPGTGTVYGYFTQITGLTFPTSLFKGAPSESTAMFTFRADVKSTQLPGNGDLGGGQFVVIPFVVAPGDFNVYFDPNPNRKWEDANTFSTGQVIATFSRTIDQQTIIGPISTNTASATLKSSSSVTLAMRPFDLGQLVPQGVTNITTISNMPLTGGTFAFGGFGIAAGK